MAGVKAHKPASSDAVFEGVAALEANAIFIFTSVHSKMLLATRVVARPPVCGFRREAFRI